MKKLFTLFLALVATTALWAYDFQVDSICYNITSDTTVEVTSSVASPANQTNYPNLTIANIPETVIYNGSTYSVTSIGNSAFSYCYSLTSVTIPNSVTSIGNYAFSRCSSLTKTNYTGDIAGWCGIKFGNSSSNPISCSHNLYLNNQEVKALTIPNSVDSIYDYAFYNCSSLTSVTIPNSVTSIGNYAFYKCSSLTSINFPNSLTTIGSYAFSGCSSLIKTNYTGDIAGWCGIKFGNSSSNPISCSHNLYLNNQEVKALTIPNSVDSIYDYAFYNCSSLTSVTIPNSVTSIGNYAFYKCSSLTSINFPNSLTTIGSYAFSGCSSLTSVTIPNSVTTIENHAFYNCSSLTSINIPNSVTSIGNSAFQYCSSLTSIIIPNSVTSIGDMAFCDCSSLSSVVFPDSILSIGHSAFGGCTALTSITIPENIQYIGELAFGSCYYLKTVTWNAKNVVCDWEHGVFGSYTKIDSIIFGNMVEHIPASICSYAESLRDLVIGNNVKTIGWGAFRGCNSLPSLTIPQSVTTIEDYAFYDCYALTSITSEAITPPTLGEGEEGYVFYGVDKSIPMHVPCGSVSAYTSASGWRLFTNIQGDPSDYTIEVSAQDSIMGIANVHFNYCNSSQISATANYGYHFTQWSDGNTDNPRTLVLTQDTALTAEFTPNQYTISTQSAQTERGYTKGDTTVNYLEHITISATANYGYHFSHWQWNANDTSSIHPLQVQVTKDETYTAYFAKNYYYITLSCNSEQGSVTGKSVAYYLDNVTLSATANYGYHFSQWSDGNTDNPRTLVLTQDTVLTAEFALTTNGQCGKNLYWDYNESTQSLSITGSGDMYNNRPWGLFTADMKEAVLPHGITHIGDDAFTDCVNLKEITIPASVTSIGVNSFAGCRYLRNVNCYPLLPPYAESTSFANYNVNLNVPCDYLEDYQYDIVFGSFKYIQCIGADSDNADTVVVTPGSTDVTITWPTKDNAYTYTIVIKKNGETVCTLTFNLYGQLINIKFAPGRNGYHSAQYAEQMNNAYRFTVTGLEESTLYTYSVETKDESEDIIDTQTGEFTTSSKTPTSLSDTHYPLSNTQKLLRDGQLIILKDGEEYNAQGVRL